MTNRTTADTLRRLTVPLRGLEGAAWTGAILGSALVVLGAAAWLARLEWFDPPYWVLVAWAGTTLVVIALCVWGWRHRRWLSVAAIAQTVEDLGVWRRGRLTALLVPPVEGTSHALYREADQSGARDLAGQGGRAISTLTKKARGHAARAAALLVVGLLLIVTAGPVDGSAALLWRPRAAWDATIAPVTLRASHRVVSRGDSVQLELQAIGRSSAVLWTRTPGEAWRSERVSLDPSGRSMLTVGPLDSDLHARLTSGTRSSETLTVTVRLPAFLGSLSVIARYPVYLRLADEPLPTNGDTLLLPAGTRLATAGQATAELAEASWVAEAVHELTVSGSSFQGDFVPRKSGVYRLQVRTVSGGHLAGDATRLPIRIVLDSTPTVEVPVPGGDTLLPVTLRIPLVVDARDDYGLRELRLSSRRISRLGAQEESRVERLPLPEGDPDRAIVSYDFDLSRRGLLPGDTVRYSVEGVDNAPRPHIGRSREYVLRLPTLREVRAAAREATDDVARQLDSLAEASRDLERRTEDLSRERPRGEAGEAGGQEESLSFEEAKRAESAAKEQERLMQQAEELRDALDALRESAEAAGIDDPDWAERLEEIRDQLDRALSSEIREKLAELQKALEELNAQRTRDALKRLAEAQKELREVLERSRDLFRRAALEGDLANLEQEARELTERQEQWTEDVAAADSAQAAAEERNIAAETDSLAQALEQLVEALKREGGAEGMDDLAREASEAAQQMLDAAERAQQGDQSGARERGQQALQQLQPLGDKIEAERAGLQQQWREEIARALDRGLTEVSRLTERQLDLERAMRSGAPPDRVLADQGAIEEGVEQLIQQMQRAAGKNALVSPEIAAGLAAAQLQMRQAREGMASAMPNTRDGAERAGHAVDALNAAAYQMLRSREDVAGAGSGSGLTEALERMSELAKQQGQLGERAGGLLPLAGTGALQAELRRLAQEQRQLAQELERLRASGQLPNTGPLAEEARDLARRLEAGRLDQQTLERQQRLFRRMLDAGRTLQGREEDERKERQSRTATGDSLRLPPALRALLSDGDRGPKIPSWEELQRFSPEERRLVVDYFRRLAEPVKR
jgi:hypothetical protein